MGNKNFNLRKSIYLVGNIDNDPNGDEDVRYKQFYTACVTGNLDKIRELLLQLRKLCTKSIHYWGKYAIDAAAENGQKDVVQYLLNDFFLADLLSIQLQSVMSSRLVFLRKYCWAQMVVISSVISMPRLLYVHLFHSL